ncbi:hypothetical protein [Isoptericola cucumis]|uniref:Uncharacterized protein n=1 Tax=Isoptericola cucumis TaxID=1776856 RepID=A0ABQ2B498_9MICO|nr:hypothetical protein [Isoptericola cucumis]GGI05744.1 hypothetical protein GCM10007368_07700 [Isoptericola cucumis]
MESSAAGVAALALFVLWLGFWVPHRLRLRQQLVDSRVDDRFSAGLRVLAVADGGRVPAPAITTDGPVPLLASGPSPDDAGGERPMGHDEHRDAPRSPAPAGSSRPQPRASRLAVLERRAARARRRLVLTLLLLLATAAGWAVVATGTAGWYAGAVPSGLLLVVLVLGRLAARAARRTDARWVAERRSAQREATQARALANGGPYVPRNRARVTGHAVRPSATHTQMIPRVSASSSGRSASNAAADDATSSRPLVSPARPDRADPVEVVTTAQVRREPAGRAPGGSGRSGGDGDREVAPAPQAPAPEQSAPAPSAPEPPAPAKARPVGGEPWDPVPVPLPTYVTKATAPPRMPRVSPDGSFTLGRQTAAGSLAATMDGALGPTATPARGAADRAADRAVDRAAAPDDGADRGAGQTADQASATAGDEPRPRTETLGLPLEQILARRRAAG